jgi:hypothetical protein
MLIGHLLDASHRLRALKAPLLVVVVSALFALLFTVATRPIAGPPPSAGEGQVRLMEEHRLVADFARDTVDAVRAADQAAADERAAMRSLAVAETAERSAIVAPPTAKPPRSTQTAAPARAQIAAVPMLPPPVPPTRPAALPLSLQANNAQPPRRGPVIERARAVAATVVQIPGWIGAGIRDVADWAIIGPAQTIARLPERRFL